jgi:hypothetical protein
MMVQTIMMHVLALLRSNAMLRSQGGKFMFKSNYFRDLLVVLLSGASLFFIGPIYLSAHSDGGAKNFSAFIVFQVGLVYFLSFVLSFSLLVFLGRFLKFNKTIDFLGAFILVWVVTSTFLFPLADHSGMITPESVPFNSINLLLVSIASIVLAILALTKLVAIPFVFSFILIVGVLFEISSFVKGEIIEDDVLKKEFSVLSEKNIIVLSFDGIPSNIVQDIFYRDKIMENKFSDFILFKNAFSSAPATSASIRSELFGNRSYRNEGFEGPAIDLASEISLLPINSIKNAYTYYEYGSHSLDKEKVLNSGAYFNKAFVKPFASDAQYRLSLSLTRNIGSIGYKALVKFRLMNFFDYINSKYIVPPSELDMAFANYANTDWKLGFVPQIYDFYGIVDSLNVAASESYTDPAIRMMHFAHTHFPVDFDEECNIRSTSKEWVESNQNYHGLYNQGICALDQFAYFLDKLKTLGVYDNTLIVLKSDHGEPAYYFSEHPHSLKINGHRYWGVNRYMPLLMLKDFNAHRNELEYKTALVGLPDLARTICHATGVGECDIFNGVNLLDFALDDLEANPDIFIDVVQDEKSSFKFETHKTIRLDRTSGTSILELFQNSDEVVLD